MKTASRILGSAGHRAHLFVQDFPAYGAQRRGAPMVAYTRISSEPIEAKGVISAPNLIIVADETLLDDPAAQALAGCRPACLVVIDSSNGRERFAELKMPADQLWIADFTSLALEQTGTLASLSTAWGVTAAELAGLGWPNIRAAVVDELTAAGLNESQRQTNLVLARAVRAAISGWPPVTMTEPSGSEPEQVVTELELDPPRLAAPSIYAIANSPARRTGNWRQFRPVLNLSACTRCWICFVRCPEAAISLDADDYPSVDYDVCKGCLLCVNDCPTRAFSVERETA